jgi:hypothetical protein
MMQPRGRDDFPGTHHFFTHSQAAQRAGSVFCVLIPLVLQARLNQLGTRTSNMPGMS